MTKSLKQAILARDNMRCQYNNVCARYDEKEREFFESVKDLIHLKQATKFALDDIEAEVEVERMKRYTQN